MSEKQRLDIALVECGYAESREKAKALIMAGIVYVNNQKSDKAGNTVKPDDIIEVRGETLKYVSRGGLKLEKAMKSFNISLDDCVCKTAQVRFIRLMWATVSLPGNCVRTSEL